MIVILKERQKGKTTELIKRADKFNGYIITRDRQNIMRIIKMADEMGCDIRYPLTYKEFINHEYYGRNIKCFHFDDADDFLQHLTLVKIETISLTKD